MSLFESLGAGPWVVITAAASWVASLWVHRAKSKKQIDDRDGRLQIHRDELTFDLLQNARNEMDIVRTEAVHLREEVKTLRVMEDHFYRFQQALDHLEALLFPETTEDRKIAERNARAFLDRMRKLKQETPDAG